MKYPFFRVGLLFFLAPFFAGLLLGFVTYIYNVVISLIFQVNNFPSGNDLLFSFILAFGGIIVYGIPALLLSALYLYLKLYKEIRSYLIVFFCGGFGAILWVPFLRFLMGENKTKGVFAFMDNSNIYLFFAIFCLGCFSSLLIALCALPKRTGFHD